MTRPTHSPFDSRGYAGSERNRALAPEEVLWARQAYFDREVTARQLATQFGMSIDSVRRMLRGETYANIGRELPQRPPKLAGADAGDGGVLERLTRGQATDEEQAENVFGEKGAER